MHFFSSSQFPWAQSKQPPQAPMPRSLTHLTAAGKRDCGWYDSSFDLSRGLEVSEQDNDTLYQLWELSQN